MTRSRSPGRKSIQSVDPSMRLRVVGQSPLELANDMSTSPEGLPSIFVAPDAFEKAVQGEMTSLASLPQNMPTLHPLPHLAFARHLIFTLAVSRRWRAAFGDDDGVLAALPYVGPGCRTNASPASR
jgi:hypothetical protein